MTYFPRPVQDYINTRRQGLTVLHMHKAIGYLLAAGSYYTGKRNEDLVPREEQGMSCHLELSLGLEC